MIASTFVILIVLIVLASIFWLWMLIDALVNEPSGVEKIVWVIVIFLLHFVGALLYFFIRRNDRRTRLT